jgi:rfaE bifunctional protein kinase chain/domain
MTPPSRVPDFRDLDVAVAGDVIADHYLVTEPKGLSREAPVMVLRFTSEHDGAGGAANVARNVRALGARTRLFGVVGRDARGRELAASLSSEGIDTTALASVPSWTTPTKTRVVAAEPRRNLQQVLRIDRVPSEPAEHEARQRITARLAELAGRVAAVVVSDYEYGMVDAELGRTAAELARRGAIVVLDPRKHLDGFDGVTAVTPNVGELARFTGRAPEGLNDPVELSRAAREFFRRVQTRWLLVTRGNLGMALFGEELPEDGLAVEASGSGNVTDVSGAGDTAAAAFALALAAGCDAPRAMELANAASGVVVMENGTAVCTPEQLAGALSTAPPPVRMARRDA